MKELSVEEKAKRFDEAIKVLSSITIYPNSKDFIKL
jgi:hypothetical protein